MKKCARACLLAAAVVAEGCQPSTPAPAASTDGGSRDRPPIVTAKDPGRELSALASDISPVVRLSSIGATKALLERTLGPSVYETPDEARYTVRQCEVTLGLDDRAAVTRVSIRLKPGCAFDASGISASEQPVRIDGLLTFAAFERLFGPARYTSPCLRDCGNAYDPSVDAVLAGSRANGFIDVSANAFFSAGPVLDASNAWEQQLIARVGEAYVDDTRFNCDPTHEAIPRATLSEVEVEELQFGRDLDSSCQ